MNVPRAALAAIAIVTLGACAEQGDLPTEGLRDIVDDVVAESAPDTVGTEEQLPDCPFGSHRELLDAALDLVDDDAVLLALAGDEVSFVTSTAQAFPPTVSCALVGSGGVAALTVSAAPDDIEEYVATFVDLAGDTTFEIDESRPYRGGRFQHICTAEGSDFQRCEIDWIDDRVLIGVQVTGEGANGMNLDSVEERFQLVLPLLIERFT